MREKFTKGPWIAKTNPANRRRWRIHAEDKNKSAIAGTAFWLESDSAEEEMANANLIAAAPDLYEALNALYKEWDDTYDGEPMNMELYQAYELARKALAKARGEK